MKRIIEGKRYDTEKAEVLATAGSNLGRRDLGWWSEALYRTPRNLERP